MPHWLEVVFVVDGSPDRSLPILLDALPQSGLNAKVIEMSRNFGAFAAIRAGLVEASGPYFAVMVADLQEPPELATAVPPPAPTRCVERWTKRPEVQPYQECWSATMRGGKRAAEARYNGPH